MGAEDAVDFGKGLTSRSSFYHDNDGRQTLKDQGFMLEWGHRAGALVCQELEAFEEDIMVTSVNLALFWHSQGSWRTSFLHRGEWS